MKNHELGSRLRLEQLFPPPNPLPLGGEGRVRGTLKFLSIELAITVTVTTALLAFSALAMAAVAPDPPHDELIYAQIAGNPAAVPVEIFVKGKAGAITGSDVLEGAVEVAVENLYRYDEAVKSGVNPDGSFTVSGLFADGNTNRLKIVAHSDGLLSPPLIRCVAVGDVNNTRRGAPVWDDGVTVTDLLMVRNSYLQGEEVEDYPERDVNASGTISSQDIVITRGLYLEKLFASPPPPAEIVSTDVDGDGYDEVATDLDYDSANGYEEYEDQDGSSEATVSTDGDGDEKTDHFIDTDGDDVPDVYWDPDGGIVSDVGLRDADGDGTEEWVYDSDGDGIPDSYYDPDDGQVYEYIESEPELTPSPTPANPTPLPAETPHYVELSVRGNRFNIGDELTLDWEVFPEQFDNVQVFIYLGVIVEPSIDDRPVGLQEALEAGRQLHMFENSARDLKRYNAGRVYATWGPVDFNKIGTRGSVRFQIPLGVNGSFAFGTTFIMADTTAFPDERCPVELSNKFRVTAP